MKIHFLTFVVAIVFLGCSPEKDSDNKSVILPTSKDVDGNEYNAVSIGDKVWTKQNLNVSHYRNGDPIPEVQDPTEWKNLTTGAWCYYQNNTVNGPVYGKLYNWYAVNDSRGLAPQGWHVASDSEWKTTFAKFGGNDVAGGAMKATENWSSPNVAATNSSGFTALAGGARNEEGLFGFSGNWGVWWTSTVDQEGIAFYSILLNNSSTAGVYHNLTQFGLYVRCVKD